MIRGAATAKSTHPVAGWLLTTLAFTMLAGCSNPQMTLQVALDDRGAATAWVRSGDKVLVIILDNEADAASTLAPFLTDPAIGSAIAQVHAHRVEVPPERRLEGVPTFSPNLELPELAPGIRSYFSVRFRDDSGSVSIQTSSVEWLLFLYGSAVLDPSFDRSDDLPELVLHPTASEDQVQWTLTLRTNGTTETHVLKPGERVVFGTTANGTRRLSGSLPAHRTLSHEEDVPESSDSPPTTLAARGEGHSGRNGPSRPISSLRIPQRIPDSLPDSRLDLDRDDLVSNRKHFHHGLLDRLEVDS